MEVGNIHFFSQEIEYKLAQEEPVRDWLLSLLLLYKRDLECINYVFCSDEYLLELNRKHLNHDYLTDILTFPYNPDQAPVLADIYISIDRVMDNAKQFEVNERDELHRVMAHGMLHLLGFDDASEAEKARMRELETEALATRTF